jgi:UPF0716 protein FxsA
MLGYLLLLFTLVPIIEIWILIRIGRVISVGATLALIVFSGVVGAALARREGLRALLRIQEAVSHGRLPAAELVEGLLVFLAGAMLVIPGVITDVAGLAILLPPVRSWLGRCMIAYFKRRMVIVRPGAGPDFRRPEEDIIDVEFRDVTHESRERGDDWQNGNRLT